ncbi:MAG: hypothetical protein GWN17_10860 [Candidatus Korarchaeota archaeon]|nr:hypothetical protein [Candidatus Thorarchaeota archaeon]NIW52698.1 hypothetical protein [Candidatus Korarchaeota archaeon]
MKTFRIFGSAQLDAESVKDAYQKLGSFYLGLADRCYGHEKPYKEGHIYIVEKTSEPKNRR